MSKQSKRNNARQSAQRKSQTNQNNAPQRIQNVARGPYGHSGDDMVRVHLRGAVSLPNRAAGIANYAIAVAALVTSNPGYMSLVNVTPAIGSLAVMYSKFCVTDLRVKVMQVTPITSNGFVAVNYEPDTTGISGPPATVADVTNSAVFAMGNPSIPAEYRVNLQQYFDDWSSTTSSDAGEAAAQQGAIQLRCENAAADGTSAAVLEVEYTIWFAGFRSKT